MYRRVPQTDDFDGGDETKYAKTKDRRVVASEAGPLDSSEQGWGGVLYYALLFLLVAASFGMIVALTAKTFPVTSLSASSELTAALDGLSGKLGSIDAALGSLRTGDTQALACWSMSWWRVTMTTTTTVRRRTLTAALP